MGIEEYKQNEKVINLIATGIVKLYEKDSKNFVFLPRELKRAINILAAQNNILINDRSDMVKIFSTNIGEWLQCDKSLRNEKFIENGIPTDFCYEMVIDSNDLEGELDQKIILSIKNEFQLHGKEEDYVAFRSFLINNPVTTRDRLDNFISQQGNYNTKLKRIYAEIYNFYEEIPEHYKTNNSIETCGYCGWTIISKDGNKHCISDYCHANLGIEKSKLIEYEDEMIRVKRGVMRYISLPGIPELRLKNKLEKLGLRVRLYPNFDQYDLEVIFKKCSWAVDIKDYSNPYTLVNKIKTFESNSSERSFILVPDKRCSFNKDYKYILEAEEPIGFEYIIEKDFIKRVKEKINNEKL